MVTSFTIKAETELASVVAAVLKVLRQRQDEGAAVLALHGDLGAGKTTFVQYLARELGVSEIVVSPTFVVMKSYHTDDNQWPHLVHIDAYRIEDIDEMRPLRFDEVLAEKEAMIVVEWAEHIASLLPPTTIHLQFTIVGDDRVITLTHGQ